MTVVATVLIPASRRFPAATIRWTLEGRTLRAAAGSRIDPTLALARAIEAAVSPVQPRTIEGEVAAIVSRFPGSRRLEPGENPPAVVDAVSRYRFDPPRTTGDPAEARRQHRRVTSP